MSVGGRPGLILLAITTMLVIACESSKSPPRDFPFTHIELESSPDAFFQNFEEGIGSRVVYSRVYFFDESEVVINDIQQALMNGSNSWQRVSKFSGAQVYFIRESDQIDQFDHVFVIIHKGRLTEELYLSTTGPDKRTVTVEVRYTRKQ